MKDKEKIKTMHSKFPNQLDKEHVDVELSFDWMKHSGLKAVTDDLS